ncbi:MAG: restriction endonuclease subunit S [Candidatus Peregrinibacteria bacterium]
MTTATPINAGYKQTELGVIPEEWEMKKLEEVADPNQRWSFTGGPFGSNLKSSDYTNDGVRIIQLQNIGDGIFHNNYAVFTSIDKADELLSCNIYPGDIILSKMGDPVARACIIPPYHERYLMCSDGIRLAVDKKKYNTYFVYLFINAPNFRNRAANAGTGSTRKRIGLTELRNLELPSPSLPEQSAIATVLSDTDALIENLEKLIGKKKAIKQGTMQQLLTGKKRLPGFSGEWEVKKLGEIFSLSATYSKSKFINDSGNYLIMDMGSVSSVGGMIASKRTHLSIDPLNKGDLVMPKDDIGGGNIIGKVAYIDQNNKYVLGDHVYKLAVKISGIETLFISYLINSNTVNSELRKKVSGSAQLGLGRKSVEEQNVNIPIDKNEQISIATILFDMDIEIEALEQKRDKYDMLKQGMMQVLLTGTIRLI